MGVFAKPSNIMVRMNFSESKDFRERFNKQVITPKHIEECKIARRLFSHDKFK